MWEAIAANRRRSRLMLACMFILLVALGAGIGFYVDPNAGAPGGALVAVVVWLVLYLFSMAGGDALLLSSVGARKIEGAELPLLTNVVEEMTLAAGLARPPAVYVIEDDALNAFAVGRSPESAAVAVTSGLLRRLSRDELQGVVGHEIGHVANLDIRFMTQAGVMLGAITLLSDGFMRSLRYGGGRRSSSRGKGGGGQAIVLLLVIVLAILAPILAQILYYACSRQREYLADASAARFTRYPQGLAAALEKISGGPALAEANRATAPMFIVNPLQSMAADGLLSTHPPIEKRVAILRAMGGADYAAYLRAYESSVGERERLVAEGSMRADAPLALRAAGEAEPPLATSTRVGVAGGGIAGNAASAAVAVGAAESGAVGPPPLPDFLRQTGAQAPTGLAARARAVNNLLAAKGGYRIIDCTCGTQLKIPPDWQRTSAICPRCNRAHLVRAAG